MASITIRNLKDEVKKRLRVRAAENGRSMEEEAREILQGSVAAPAQMAEDAKPYRTGADLYDEIRALVEPLGGIELPVPPRHPVASDDNIFDSIRRKFEPVGGVELKLPRRGRMRKLPRFK